jgi:ATP-dependent DNA ligase
MSKEYNLMFVEEYTINKKIIETEHIDPPDELHLNPDDDVEALPILYALNKIGKVNWWRVYIFTDYYYRLGGMVNGKTREYTPVYATSKNIGKSNETSGHEQAIFEAKSHWNKKVDQGYRETIPNETEEKKDEIIKPMLANKYVERGEKYLKLPFGGSRKFDGIRCIAMLTSDGKVRITSRNGKVLNFMECIRKQIVEMLSNYGNKKIILDGELYNHSMPFNEISGLARKTTTPSKYDEKIQLHIYDIVDENMIYSERVEELKKLQVLHNERFIDGNLKFEFYELINSHDEVKELHDKYVKEGYEGLMLRNLDGMYKQKYRSNDLLKYKDFEDMEVEVVGALQSESGNEKGAVVFVCAYPGSEKTFTVRPRGSIAKRRWQYKQKINYIGKQLTIRFQKTGLDDGSLPRFPVGIKFQKNIENAEPVDFRDYE